MNRHVLVLVLAAGLAFAGATAAAAKGEPQGPHEQPWVCILDLGNWHCVPPGVLANFGGPSGPSLNWVCDDPQDALCGPESYGAASLGPPPGTHFAGTENLIRADLYAGQPCPTGSSGFVDLGVAVYWFCHHYGDA